MAPGFVFEFLFNNGRCLDLNRLGWRSGTGLSLQCNFVCMIRTCAVACAHPTSIICTPRGVCTPAPPRYLHAGARLEAPLSSPRGGICICCCVFVPLLCCYLFQLCANLNVVLMNFCYNCHCVFATVPADSLPVGGGPLWSHALRSAGGEAQPHGPLMCTCMPLSAPQGFLFFA